MRHLLAILSISLLLLTGCRHSASDPGIRMAEQLADSLPAEALAILDTIPAETLSGHDLFLHRLLTIKTNDKLYVTHTSDSLLLPVLKYARDNRRSVNYPEVLYYAGRVYDDLGDYPTALDYYHQALDALPDDKDLKLRANILSNLSFLYYSCFLYDEAEYYIFQSIMTDSVIGDTLNQIYDLDNLESIYYYKNEFDKAIDVITKIKALTHNVQPQLYAEQNVNLARIMAKKGEIDKALCFVRNREDSVLPYVRNYALATSSEIYLIAGITDSAYMYAMEVTKSNSHFSKDRAYSVLLDPSLSSYVSRDSLKSYANQFARISRKTLNENGDKLTLIKSAQYNYFIHERERLKAESRASNFYLALVIALIVIFAVSVLTFWLKIKSQRQQVKIAEYQRDIALMKEELSRLVKSKSSKAGQKSVLLEKIEEKLAEETPAAQSTAGIDRNEACMEIISRMKRNKPVQLDDPAWEELKTAILRTSPEFITNLETLLERPLKDIELSIAMLIKCNESPTSIASILGRAKGSVSYHRETMGCVIFGKKVTSNFIDPIIKLL